MNKGYWIKQKDGTLCCSECYSVAPYETDRNGSVTEVTEYPFCPWCGKEMQGGGQNE